MECVDSVKSQEFLMSGPDSLRYHLLSEAVYGFGQYVLLRFDPHRVGFLYIECHSNPLPRGIWQRLPLSTERSLLNRSGKKTSVQSSCKAISVLQAEHIIEHRCQRSFP